MFLPLSRALVQDRAPPLREAPLAAGRRMRDHALVAPLAGELKQLEVLNLAHNRLVALPPSLGQLARLKVLGLRSNALRALPTELGGLAALESLFLTHNRLAALPQSIGRCAALRTARCPRLPRQPRRGSSAASRVPHSKSLAYTYATESEEEY